ncbi:MAG: DUF4236 domain-containing protein [Actinobacteria bacterium]|nr:DUF4236 domain-containing protein [Actinomycetota bacterium]
MPWSFRRSKTCGPLRLTLGKRGVSGSVGGKGVRVTKSSTGSSGISFRLPGGLSFRKSRR